MRDRRDSAGADDRASAERERQARRELLALGADGLERRPWQPAPIPPSAADLIHFFLWRSSVAAEQALEAPTAYRVKGDRKAPEASTTTPEASTRTPEATTATPGARAAAAYGVPAEADLREAALAALRLLPVARAELDQLETGLLFTARGLGLTWGQMAQALGLNSPQACQQRLDRLTSRGARATDGPAT
ncbi:hypothetical protein [Kribbella flavida]|uniref:hypothetical protein n=1 Tax=Kribbella flavida TaxID=182640 RepID=UPI00059C2472|nr:hypothetical protein [Kribbella flavida]